MLLNIIKTEHFGFNIQNKSYKRNSKFIGSLHKRRPDARPGPAGLILNAARGPSGLEKSGNLYTLVATCKRKLPLL